MRYLFTIQPLMHELPVSRKELESLLKIIWWSSFPTKWSKARLWDCWLYPKQWFLCLCSIWLYHHNSRVTIYSSYQNKFDIFIWRLWTGKRLTCSFILILIFVRMFVYSCHNLRYVYIWPICTESPLCYTVYMQCQGLKVKLGSTHRRAVVNQKHSF